MRLAHSIQLTETLYINEDECDHEDEEDTNMLADQHGTEQMDDNVHAITDEHTLVSAKYSSPRLSTMRLIGTGCRDTHPHLVSNSSLRPGIDYVC